MDDGSVTCFFTSEADRKSICLCLFSTHIVVEQGFKRLKIRWRVLLDEQQESRDIAALNYFECMGLHNLEIDILDSSFRTSWSIPVIIVEPAKYAHIENKIMAARLKNSHKRCTPTTIESFNGKNNNYIIISLY